MFYGLLASGMQYLEQFNEEDIKTLRESTATADTLRTNGMSHLTTKAANKMHAESIKRTEQRRTLFMNRSYEELNNVRKNMNKDSRLGFDGVVSYTMACVEETMFAPHHDEIIMLLKMYNAGELDMLFEDYRKKQQEEILKPDAEN